MWKKALGAFFEFNDEPKQVNPNQPIKTQLSTPSSTATPAIKTYPTDVTAQPIGTVNNDLKVHIENLIKDNNLPGPDFYEFKVMLDALKAVPMEDVRYTSAYGALTVQGMTREVLISSAEKYKELIVNDQKEFEVAFAGMFKEQVEDKKTAIAQKSQEMQELSLKIQALNEEIKTLNVDAANAETKLTLQKGQYINAGNSVIQDIDAELNNINKYIK